MPDNFAELRRLAEAATTGPWEVVQPQHGHPTEYLCVMLDEDRYYATLEMLPQDARFIAACREGVPALLAELDRQANEIAALRAEVARQVARWSHAAAAAYSDDEFRMGAER